MSKETEYETLLALKPHLNKYDGATLEKMVKNKQTIDSINIFVNNSITKDQVRYTTKLSQEEAQMEYKEYEHKLTEGEKLWIQKFYVERYCNGAYKVPKDFRLTKTKEMLKENNRIRNSGKTDMFEIGLKSGKLESLDNYENVLHKPDNPTDWETIYSLFGHECSLNFLIEECQDELKIQNLDTRLTLVRFYIKMNRLRLAHNREERLRGTAK